MKQPLDSDLQTAWKVVEKSRHPQRPYTLDYVEKIFEDFEELKGDRLYGEDAALIGGIGRLKAIGSRGKTRNVVLLGHQKGRNTKQKIERNNKEKLKVFNIDYSSTASQQLASYKNPMGEKLKVSLSGPTARRSSLLTPSYGTNYRGSVNVNCKNECLRSIF